MPRYINPDKIDFRLPYLTDTYGDALVSLSAVRSAIAQTPGEDVVEVVRCKDCKFFEKDDEFDMTGFCTCERITKNYGGEIYPYENDFCSYGERKEQA